MGERTFLLTRNLSWMSVPSLIEEGCEEMDSKEISLLVSLPVLRLTSRRAISSCSTSCQKQRGLVKIKR